MNVADVNESLFWAKVDKSGGEDACWLWTASLNKGYGQFNIKGKTDGAHRVAYTLLVGTIPPKMDIDHLCRCHICVNPKHLEPVTHRENILRGECFAAVNAKKTACMHGHLFDAANTYVDNIGTRHCRECRRQCDARRYLRRRQKAVAANG